jgi:serine/threonine-protein kinase
MWSVSELPSEPRPVTRFALELAPNRRFAPSTITPVAITPDGRRIVFSAGTGSSSSLLYVRPLERMASVPVDGVTSPIGSLFVSPDGKSVGYTQLTKSGGAIKRVGLDGGHVTTIADVRFTAFSGASWGARGQVAFSVNGGVAGLQIVPESGGAPRPVTQPAAGERHLQPHFLPDGERVLFVRRRDGEPDRMAAIDLPTGEMRDVGTGSWPRYIRTGHLLFVRDTALWAAPFDTASLEVRGDAVRVLEDAGSPGGLSVSADGTLVYGGPTGLSGRMLVWVDRAGAVTRLPVEPADYWLPRLSPDGGRLAVGIAEDLWVIDLERGARTRVTNGQTSRLFPYTWTPDGREILFSSRSATEIQRVPADGSGRPVVVLGGQHQQWPTSWSAVAQGLAYYVNNPGAARDLWVLPARPGAAPSLLLGTPFQERAGVFSPDGRWLAYVSDESGRDEVYVRPYPGPGRVFAVSSNGGTQPVWSRQAPELFYRDLASGDLVVVPVRTGESLSAGAPQRLFGDDEFVLEMGGGAGGNPTYDVDAGGRRFVMLQATPIPAEVHVVTNWFSELARLLPEK